MSESEWVCIVDWRHRASKQASNSNMHTCIQTKTRKFIWKSHCILLSPRFIDFTWQSNAFVFVRSPAPEPYYIPCAYIYAKEKLPHPLSHKHAHNSMAFHRFIITYKSTLYNVHLNEERACVSMALFFPALFLSLFFFSSAVAILLIFLTVCVFCECPFDFEIEGVDHSTDYDNNNITATIFNDN